MKTIYKKMSLPEWMEYFENKKKDIARDPENEQWYFTDQFDSAIKENIRNMIHSELTNYEIECIIHRMFFYD